VPRLHLCDSARNARSSINGETHQLDIERETPMLWVLRDELGLTGTKFGCGITQCGACTIHVDGEATRSCQLQAGEKQSPVAGL
jgi:isoquinoline 1-oxidoreductase subunit alpha